MHLTFIWKKQPVSIAVLKKNASYCKNSLVWNFEEQSTKIPRWPCEFKSKEMQWSKSVCAMYCMKSVYIRSFSGPYFPAFELNRDTQSVKPRIKSEWKNTDQENSIHKDSLKYRNFAWFMGVEILWSFGRFACKLCLSTKFPH